MFKNKKEPGAAALARPARSAVPSIISADMVIEGNLHSNGDVQIEGVVMGDIAAGKLVIAEGGSVSGNISAAEVRICGALTGVVRSEMVTLTATARVLGDIHHDLLAIETGGRLEGQSRRLHPDPQLAAPVDMPAETPAEAPLDAAWTNGENREADQNESGHDHGQHDNHDHAHGHNHEQHG